MNDQSVPAGPAAERRPRLVPMDDGEPETPSTRTVLKLIYNTVARLFRDRVGMILGSTFVLLMLWGTHGKVELLTSIWGGWRGPGSDPAARARIVAGIPWDQEWLSFAIGAVLLVGVPVLLIKLVYRQRLSDYGLCLPPKGRRAFALISAALLFACSLPAFYLAIHDPAMRAEYPLYRGVFETTGRFLAYELGYLLFFVVIEFIFRGYLLFGLYRLHDRDAPEGIAGLPGPLVFGHYAIFISMLSYTAWHLGKPVPELWGTLVWGIAAGTIVWQSRSVVPVILVHWLLNVFLDFAMWRQW